MLPFNGQQKKTIACLNEYLQRKNIGLNSCTPLTPALLQLSGELKDRRWGGAFQYVYLKIFADDDAVRP